jgi:hypothetical protein
MAQQVWVRGLDRAQLRRLGYTPNAAKIDSSADLVDLDDGQVRKFLQGDRSRFVVLPDFVATLQKEGTIATATTASGLVYVAPRAFKLYRVIISVGTAPTGATLIADVHKVAAGGATTDAGTTIFTTQSRRPTIAISGTTSPYNHATSGVPEVTDVAQGDILRVEIDQVGSGVAGANLVVQFLGY